jgi:hypothetical protein
MRSLKIYSFALLVDDVKLNELPLHLTRMVSLQSNYNPASATNSSNRGSVTAASSSSSGGGGGFFDAFLRSFEIGFDTFVSQVDQLISTPIVIPESLKNPLLVLDNSPPPQSVFPNNANNNSGTMNGAGPMPSFFGSSMRQLILEERRCAHAHLDPYLGIPIQALRMINFLSHHANTPNLFRVRASVNGVDEMKRLLEQEKALQGHSFTSKDDIAIVCTVFINWLSQLPEPLFGYDHYHAIIACENLDNVQEKIQVVKLLLCDSPWYYKPLLVKLFSFWQKCLSTEVSVQNGLNSIALALIATPICLRPPPGDPIYGQSTETATLNNDAIVMSITAVASGMIQFILEHCHEVLLDPFQQELSLRQEDLTMKWQRIRLWQQELLLMIDWKQFLAHEPLHLAYVRRRTMSNMSDDDTTPSSSATTRILPAAGEDDREEDLYLLEEEEESEMLAEGAHALLEDASIHSRISPTDEKPLKSSTQKNRRSSASSGSPSAMFATNRSSSSGSNGQTRVRGNSSSNNTYIGLRRMDEMDFYLRRLWKALRPVHQSLSTTTTGVTAASMEAVGLYEGSSAADSLLTTHSVDTVSPKAVVTSSLAGQEETKAGDVNTSGDSGRNINSSAATLDEQDTDLVSRMSRSALFHDVRWSDCAFSLSHQPLQDCAEVNGGYVAVKCLVLFLEMYPDKAPGIALAFAQSRRRFCSMPQVAVKLVQFVAEVLSLSASTAFAAKTVDATAPLSHLARQPSWPLLTTATSTSDYGTFGELFNLSMFIFDDIWRGQCDILHEPVSLETFSQSLYHTRSILWELILQRPHSIPKLWEIWANNVRLAQVERLYAVKRKQAVLSHQRPLGQLTAHYGQTPTASNTMNASNSKDKEPNAGTIGDAVIGTAKIVTSNASANAAGTASDGKERDNSSRSKRNKSISKKQASKKSIVSNATSNAGEMVELSLDSEDDMDVDDDNSISYSSSGSDSGSSSSDDDEEEEEEEEEEGFDGTEGIGFESSTFTIQPPTDSGDEGSMSPVSPYAPLSGTLGARSAPGVASSADTAAPAVFLQLDLRASNRSRSHSQGNASSLGMATSLGELVGTTGSSHSNSLSTSLDSSHKSETALLGRLISGRGIHTVVTSAGSDAPMPLPPCLRNNNANTNTREVSEIVEHTDVPTSNIPNPDCRQTDVVRSSEIETVETKPLAAEDSLSSSQFAHSVGIYIDDPHNEVRNRVLAAEAIVQELSEVAYKTHPNHRLTTQIRGASKLLTVPQILALELKLPATLQCYDWQLIYRLSIHGASLHTLYSQAQKYANMILIVQENTSRRALFGAVITDSLKVGERDKYYGNGSMALFSMYHPETGLNYDGVSAPVNSTSTSSPSSTTVNNTIRYYPWSYRNSYFLIACRDYLALGGGGHFGLFLDSDLLRGSSGESATFQNTCLGSIEDFPILQCELYALQAPTRS